jgi:hypothetical protein
MSAKFTYADLTDADLAVFGNVSDDEDLGNKSDDEWRPKKGVTASAEEMDKVIGKAELGRRFVQRFDPSVPGDPEMNSALETAVHKVYPLVTAPPTTMESMKKDVADLDYDPTLEELTAEQHAFIDQTGKRVQPILPTLPTLPMFLPKRASVPALLPVKVSSRPMLKSYRRQSPGLPPTRKRGGASRKTKKSRRARRVKTQMRRKNSSRKSTRRRTRK